VELRTVGNFLISYELAIW